ncbi:MAG TPA: TauD/TfdA family dioxygenase [Novosphingobium sp.]|nr:TauD/TfdA family dioxygenase [Novosphingobium sp.]
MEVSKLADDLPFGVQVRALRHADLQSTEIVKELRNLWIQHGMIVFREVDDNPEFQIELSRCFGNLEPHPVRELWVAGSPDLISIASKPEAGNIVKLDGKIVANWIPWHSDLTYVPQINRGGMLRVTKKTTWGGQTCFSDQIDAYNRLPTSLRERIEGREVVYQMNIMDETRYAKRHHVELLRMSPTLTALKQRLDTDFPPVAHPAVYVQQETGRKVLNVSPMFAEGIVGMDREEGGALLDEIFDHIDSCPSYRHTWGDNEMILWDNWRMLHAVTGAPTDEERVMRRTTIGGDYGLGRTLGYEYAI